MTCQHEPIEVEHPAHRRHETHRPTLNEGSTVKKKDDVANHVLAEMLERLAQIASKPQQIRADFHVAHTETGAKPPETLRLRMQVNERQTIEIEGPVGNDSVRDLMHQAHELMQSQSAMFRIQARLAEEQIIVMKAESKKKSEG